jgi:hypothetical protein
MTCAGNHEIERGNAGHTFQSWSARLPNPWRESGSSSPQYYSLSYGGGATIAVEGHSHSHAR